MLDKEHPVVLAVKPEAGVSDAHGHVRQGFGAGRGQGQRQRQESLTKTAFYLQQLCQTASGTRSNGGEGAPGLMPWTSNFRSEAEEEPTNQSEEERAPRWK